MRLRLALPVALAAALLVPGCIGPGAACETSSHEERGDGSSTRFAGIRCQDATGAGTHTTALEGCGAATWRDVAFGQGNLPDDRIEAGTVTVTVRDAEGHVLATRILGPGETAEPIQSSLGDAAGLRIEAARSPDFRGDFMVLGACHFGT